MSPNVYDKRYNQPGYYWGKSPSKTCKKVLDYFPPARSPKLLDIGCGEGRNSVFFACNGYRVTAFDLSQSGIEKAMKLAAEANVSIDVFKADINNYRLTDEYDVIFGTGVLHYIPEELRAEILENYRAHTAQNGLNVFSVIIKKPFIPRAPDEDPAAQKWISGEIFTYYHDWKIEHCEEEIFDCTSSNTPHKHAVNRIIARRV